MKKILLIILCVVLLLSGCAQQQKAEPFYSESGEGVRFEAEYKYYFTDETIIGCNWYNETEGEICFHDTFRLEQLGKDGEWYLVDKGDEVSFNTKYCHGVYANTKSGMNYDISLYTNKISEGNTYRISTYYFDENDNYYQVYAEFICDNKLAEEEMFEISDGIVNNRQEHNQDISDKINILPPQ
ncbi:MAG: hypothetical protein IKU42_07230 [Oscillospiraceae bacterium]|nr:hypothetical protein [Oscillospiraceae bacterium]